MTASFFSRLAKYQPRQFLDPRENRLTELTAALLERDKGFCRAFVDYLLRDAGDSSGFRVADPDADLDSLRAALHRSDPSSGEIKTQVSTLKGRFVDLAVRFRDPNDRLGGLLIWVEVKDGSDLHGDQLFAYAEAVATAAGGSSSCVILLVPRGWTTQLPSQVPSSVLVADWTGVADVARKCGAEKADGSLDRWLLDEYSNYLREEGLSDPEHETFDQLAADAIARGVSIRETKEALCREATRLVASDWGPVSEREKGRGKDFWSHFDVARTGTPSISQWGGAWFEFGLRSYRDLEGLEFDGEYSFMAGAVFPRYEAEAAFANEAWLARIDGEGFRQGRIEGIWHMVTRLLEPGELVGQGPFEAQAAFLADWVGKSFAVLASAPPVGVAS